MPALGLRRSPRLTGHASSPATACAVLEHAARVGLAPDSGQPQPAHARWQPPQRVVAVAVAAEPPRIRRAVALVDEEAEDLC